MGDLAYQNKKYNDAYRLYNRYGKLMEGTQPCSLIAKKMKSLHKLKKCRKMLALSIKRCPKFNLLLLRGQCYEVLKNDAQALQEYKKARRQASDLVEPLIAIANLYFKQNRYKEAAKFYSMLNRKNPRERLYLLRLLQLHRRAKRFNKAMIMLRRYNNVMQPDNDFDLQIEEAHLLVAKSKFRRAQKQLSTMAKSFKKSSQQIRLQYVLASFHEKKKKHKLSVKAYSKILALDPKQYNAYRKRAVGYYKLNKYENCYNDAKNYLKFAPPKDSMRKTGSLIRDACEQKIK